MFVIIGFRQASFLLRKPSQQHVRQLMTSAYNHSGLREDGTVIFKELLAMAQDETPVR